MTSRQYARIEELLVKVEHITEEHPLLTTEGKRIQAELRDMLVKVAAERIRAQDREGVPPSKSGRH